MVDPGLTVIQDSIGSATLENTGELTKFNDANNNNITTTPLGHGVKLHPSFPCIIITAYCLCIPCFWSYSLPSWHCCWDQVCLTSLLSGGVLKACFEFAIFGTA